MQFLDDQENALSHLLCQQGQFDEVLVLVSVADDEAVGVHVGGQHGVKFGFGTRFQSQVVAFAVANNLLHDRAHLVDLHGVDNEVVSLVVVLFFCLDKALGRLLDAVVEDIGKA